MVLLLHLISIKRQTRVIQTESLNLNSVLQGRLKSVSTTEKSDGGYAHDTFEIKRYDFSLFLK